MPTISKAFSLNVDAEGWTAVASTGTTMTRDTTEDSPNDTNAGAGALQTRTSGKNVSNKINFWSYGADVARTWESLGVPAGSTVTAVNAAYDHRCAEYNTVSAADTGPLELRNADGSVLRHTFSGAVAYAATTAWATQAGTALTGLNEPSNTQIRLRINSTQGTANSTSAVVNVRQDWIVVTVTYETPATYAQNAYRFYKDDAAINLATARAAQNTAINMVARRNFRLRFNVGSSSAAPTQNKTFQLQYQRTPSGGTAGAWTNVTGASSVARASASSHVADAAATTELLAGAGTFNAGTFDEVDGVATGFTAATATGQDTELEYSVHVRPADVGAGDIIDFRLISDGAALNSYTQTPRLTVVANPNGSARIPVTDPTTTLATGADTGQVKIRLKKELNGGTTNPPGNPTATIELRDGTAGGAAILKTLATNVAVTDTTSAGALLTYSFDQTGITTPANAAVWVTTTNVVGASVRILPLEWNAQTSALTRVTSERTASWNVTGRVASTRSASWNVQARASSERQAVWNTRASVSSARSASWNVTGRIASERQAIWNVEAVARVTSERQASWNIASRITSDRQAVWNVQARTTSDRAASWNVRASVASSRQALWNVVGRVASERQAIWNVEGLTRVTSERQALWNVGGRVAATRQAIWHVYEYVTTDPSGPKAGPGPDPGPGPSGSGVIRWNVIGRVTSERQAIWNVDSALTRVTSERQALWNAVGRIAATRQALWNVGGRVASERVALWNVHSSVTSSRAASWQVLLRLASERQALWDIKSRLASERQALWHIGGKVSSERQALWNTLSRTSSERVASWRILSQVLASRQALWNIYGRTSSDRVILWNVEGVAPPFYGHVYGSVVMLSVPGAVTSLDGIPAGSTAMASVPTSGATLLGVPMSAVAFLTPTGATVLISPPAAQTTMDTPPLAATTQQDNPRGAVTKWEHRV